MPIIFPDKCKNTTAGALRQIKQKGFTTAGTDGGAFSTDYVESMLARPNIGYTYKTEPLGAYMNQLEQAKVTIDQTTDAVSNSTRKMQDGAKEAAQCLLDASRKIREATEKMTVQMQKFNTTFANVKFEEQAKSIHLLAESLERLARLEESGRLSKIMDAMSK